VSTRIIRSIMPKGLFARSLLILTVPVLLIQIITIFVFLDRYWDEVTRRLVDGVMGEIAAITQMVTDEPPRYQFYEIQQASESNLKIILTSEEGTFKELEKPKFTLFNSWPYLVYKALDKAAEYKIDYPHQISINTQDRDVLIQVQLENQFLNYNFSLKRIFSSSSYIFLLWMIGASFVLLIVAILFMRNQIRPIRRLAVAADRFGKGRDIPFFKVSGSSEIRLAAQSFLDMKDRINRQIQQRTTMLAGVSHDLRTPLTRMKLQLEMMKETDDVKAMKADINDMEKMISAYLQFARGEAGEETRDVDLKELTQRAIDSVTHLDAQFILNAPAEKYMVPVKEMAIIRCIVNILTNADRFADMVQVTLEKKESSIRIFIDDNGEGLSVDQYEDVFKPFYRGDKSRNVKTASVGLGLTIAQDIISSHGGSIELDKSPMGGLRVILDLPL